MLLRLARRQLARIPQRAPAREEPPVLRGEPHTVPHHDEPGPFGNAASMALCAASTAFAGIPAQKPCGSPSCGPRASAGVSSHPEQPYSANSWCEPCGMSRGSASRAFIASGSLPVPDCAIGGWNPVRVQVA